MAFRTNLARLALLLVGLAAGNARGDPTTLISHDYEHDAREMLPLCEADSRIGYGSGGTRVGGLFTPALIRWKIDQVEQMLEEGDPRSR